MPKCIYCEHYYDKIARFETRTMLDFYRIRNNNISDNDFVQKAIFLSKKERLSLDVLENESKLSADFITKTLLLSPESTALLEQLVAASDLIEILFPDNRTFTVTIRLGRVKNNNTAAHSIHTL